MHKRLISLQKKIGADEALLISKPSDITYLTGFSFLTPLDQEREAYLIVSHHQATLIHASFSPVVQRDGVTLVAGCTPSQLKKTLDTYVEAGVESILFDETNLFFNEYEAVKSIAAPLKPQLHNAVMDLRTHKDAQELEVITAACKATETAWKRVSTQLSVGMTEHEVCQLLEAEMRSLGAKQQAFPTIVCFGEHSAIPHHQPTHTILKEDMPVLIDMGAKIDGYCSDMTRTFWFGQKPSEAFLGTQRVVMNAYHETIAFIREQLKIKKQIMAKQIDEVARNIIRDAGFGALFIHTTGHGLGLEIHEPPSLNWKNEEIIHPGMILTIEPGIYHPNAFGYRYENTIALTKQDVLELTLTPS